MNISDLRELVQQQANVLVATGTGKLTFDDADADYRKTFGVLASEFRRLGLKVPFPWRSPGEWHGFCSRGEMPTYASRRLYIGALVNTALEQLDEVEGVGKILNPANESQEPTWENIDARISGLIQEYSTAHDKDSWQDVGRRSREILIDLGKLIADPALVPNGESTPKGADARAWFELLLDARASGGEHAELRALMRKAWDLAQKVTHGDIDDIDAYAAAQATVMLVRTAQKLLASREKPQDLKFDW